MREPDVRCDASWCTAQADVSVAARFAGGHHATLCTRHARRAGSLPECAGDRPLLRDPRIACIVVAAITGAVPHDRATWSLVLGMLRAAWAMPVNDTLHQATISVALDLIEEAGLHEPEAWPTDAGVEWPRVVHEHRWFGRPDLVRDEAGRVVRQEWEVGRGRQCTCGMLEQEWLRQRAIDEHGPRVFDW